MDASDLYLSPAQAARRLGVSAKALRLYEGRGLVTPTRTSVGWRMYGPAEMARAGEVVGLRSLGLSLAQVESVLGGEVSDLEPALAAHQRRLQADREALAAALVRVAAMRADLANGRAPTLAALIGLGASLRAEPELALELPWPWAGERFAIDRIAPLNWIVGPLGSGKTRLARTIAAHMPGALFSPMERVDEDEAATATSLDSDRRLAARVRQAESAICALGGDRSSALRRLLVDLEDPTAKAVVVDMVEEGLDGPTQAAVALHVRRTARRARPLFLMTRSSLMLDPARLRPEEQILMCPANHDAPLILAFAGAPGHEAVATCLGSPEARARTRGLAIQRAPLH